MDIRVELVAQFLEDFAREEDEARELYPSSKRLQKTDTTWYGFIRDAGKLVKIIDDKLFELLNTKGN